MSEAEKRLLLFDETPEYNAMNKKEKKAFFKESSAKLTSEQKKKRLDIKIKNHGKAVTQFKQMKNMKTMKENKINDKLEKKAKKAKKVKKVKKQVTKNNKTVLDLPEPKKINKTGAYADTKLASGYIEGVAGATKRKSTKKNSKHGALLDYLSESDSLKKKEEEVKKEEEDEDEPEWKKNIKKQAEIRKANKKLRKATTNLKTTYYGYHNLNKKNNVDVEKSNEFTKNKNFDDTSLFDNENMHGRQSRVNPPLQNKKLNLETPGVVNFQSLLHEMQRGNDGNVVNNFNFRRLGGMRNNEGPVIVMTNSDVVKVFKWHETRLDKYKDALELCQEKFEEINNYTTFLEKRIHKLENDTVYTDYKTLLIRDESVRKIQSTWRWYKFKMSFNAILIQRWFRYKKNVTEVSDDVKKFFDDIRVLREEAAIAESYLLSLNSSKALPLSKLKEIKNKMKHRLDKVQKMKM